MVFLQLIFRITLAACLVGLAAGSSAALCREMQCFAGVDIAPEAEHSSNTRDVKYIGRMSTVLECENACLKYKVSRPSYSHIAHRIARALPRVLTDKDSYLAARDNEGGETGTGQSMA